jgi:hypothetical protein
VTAVKKGTIILLVSLSAGPSQGQTTAREVFERTAREMTILGPGQFLRGLRPDALPSPDGAGAMRAFVDVVERGHHMVEDSRAAPGHGFSFAGLSLHTTLEEVRKRYPRSLISGHHVYVAETDSHDHIGAIDLPDDGQNRNLRVFFERKTARGNAYPPCQAVLGTLVKQYGDPLTVQEFDEERARNRRFVWRRGDEALSLLCFRLGRPTFSASELTIGPVDR